MGSGKGMGIGKRVLENVGIDTGKLSPGKYRWGYWKT